MMVVVVVVVVVTFPVDLREGMPASSAGL